ncbi:MAG: phosphatase PAP2 family protein [Ramlibacter sp.]
MTAFAARHRFFIWTAASLALLLGWDAMGFDMPMARWFGQAGGFALRDHWLFSDVLHDGARRLAWLIAAWLFAGVWWPTGVLHRLERQQRVQLAVTTLLALLVINLLKHASRTSCPWDLAEFGGIAEHISHWRWGLADGGGGRCFPAGHALAGFAFLGGYFVLRPVSPRMARAWLGTALTAGLVLGLAQQVRGAHFMSHTLWTGWLCWTTAWLVDSQLFPAFRRAAGVTPAP